LAKVGFMLPIADERNSAASRLRDFDSGSTGTTQELPFALAAELVGTSQQWSSFTN
jgi:hypothetical protein